MAAMNNFKQAVKELFGTKETEEFEIKEENDVYTDLDVSFLDKKDAEEPNDNKTGFLVQENDNEESLPRFVPSPILNTPEEAPMNTNLESSMVQMKTTTIASDTSVIGEVHSDGHVEILGNLIGDVSARGNIKICGKVVGDINGNDIELFSSKVHGNITAEASVLIDGGSVSVGDITAIDMILDGKLKGDITLEKSIEFKENATLLGKVTAGSVSIKEGAKLYGEIRIQNCNEDESIFDEM